jgi:hypothetical protein
MSDPVPNVKVQIHDAGNKLAATVHMDQDGWYMWPFKYAGKASSFTVKLPSYNRSQAVTRKSNGFVLASFTLPCPDEVTPTQVGVQSGRRGGTMARPVALWPRPST